MEKKTLDTLLKDAAHWSRMLETVSEDMKPEMYNIHNRLSFDNEFIVKNNIERYMSFSRLLAQTLADIQTLQSTKKTFLQKLLKK